MERDPTHERAPCAVVAAEAEVVAGVKEVTGVLRVVVRLGGRAWTFHLDASKLPYGLCSLICSYDKHDRDVEQMCVGRPWLLQMLDVVALLASEKPIFAHTGVASSDLTWRISGHSMRYCHCRLHIMPVDHPLALNYDESLRGSAKIDGPIDDLPNVTEITVYIA